MNYKEIKSIIRVESAWYKKYLMRGHGLYLLYVIRHYSITRISKWQVFARLTDYYKVQSKRKPSFYNKWKYLYYGRRKNILGEKLSIEANTVNVGTGLKILHYNVVIHDDAKIGKNLILLGSNVIGNGGPKKLGSPIIGDNVVMGAGAKVLGPVIIADNITIAAGAVVVNSFMEKGITIAGIPARKIK